MIAGYDQPEKGSVMTRHVMQMRPQGDPNGKQYSPQRDLANIFLPMVEEVFRGLDEQHIAPFFKKWFAEAGVTDADVGLVADRLVTALTLFTRTDGVKQPHDAFIEAGMLDTSEHARQAVFARIGEVLIGGFFVAIRDVTMKGEQSSCQEEMAKMVAAGRELSARLSGPLTEYPTSDFAILQETIAEQNRVIKQATALREALQISTYNAERRTEEVTAQLQKHEEELQRLAAGGGLWARVCNAAWLAWRAIRRRQ